MASVAHGLIVFAFFCGFVIHSASGKDDRCYERVNILFVMDASGSVGSDNFNKQLQFASNLTALFSIGEALFSVIRFESTPSIIFSFGDYLDENQLRNAIINIPYTSGGTDTAAAIKLVREHGFLLTQGARAGVPKVVIICTDGMSNNPYQTKVEAENLKNTSTLVLAVGIGSGVNKQELYDIASFPEDVFEVTDYNQLLSVIHDYAEMVCDEVKLFDCYNDADVFFLVESSSGTSQGDFQNALSYVSNVISKLKMPDYSFGAATFGGTVQRIFRLGELKDQNSIAQALSSASPVSGATNLDLALRYILDNLVFETNSGGRVNATKVLVVVYNGGSTSPAQDKQTAQQLRNLDINIMAVGMSHPNITELQDLVSDGVLDVVANLVFPNVTSRRIEALAAYQECKVPTAPVRDVSNRCKNFNLENGIHPHPYDCTKYIMCTYQKTDIMPCPPDQGYDAEIQTCNRINLVEACKSKKDV